MHQTRFFFARAPPQTPLGRSQRFPRSPSWILGVLLLTGKGEEKKKRKKKGSGGARREEKGRKGRSRDKRGRD